VFHELLSSITPNSGETFRKVIAENR